MRQCDDGVRVPSIYSIVPPNDGSAFRYGHHFEPVDFVIDHGRGHHDAHSTGSCQRASPVSRRDRAAAVRGPPVRRRSGADIPRSDAPGIGSVCRSKSARQMEREFGCRQAKIGLPGDAGCWLINLEELPSAVQMGKSAVYQLVLDRKVGEYERPEGASLIACGNRESDRVVVHRMPTPLASRFVHLEIKVDPRTGLPGGGERNRARGPVLIVLHHERRQIVHFGVTAVPSIYSIVPPNDGSALRHGHHFEPVDFVIDHGRGCHDAYSAGSCQRTYARACGCRQRPRRHKEELIESERGWSGREAFVTMMQTADLGQGNDRSGPGRLNGSTIRCVLADRQVGP